MSPRRDTSGRVSPRQLECFLAIVEEGSAAAASRRLGVAPATVSRSLHALEARLGATLFELSSHPPRLTQHGEVAAQAARRALQFLDAVPREVSGVDAMERGALTVMTLPSLTEPVVSLAAARFRAAHPNVTLRIVAPEGPLLHYIALAVESGAADLAVTELTYRPERLAVHDLLTQEVVGIMPPGTPLPPSGAMDLEEFVRHGVVVGPYWDHSAAGRRVRALVPEVDAMTVARTVFRDQVLHLVLAGVGVGHTWHDMATPARAFGAEVVRIRPRITRHVGVLHHPQRLSTAARAFMAILRQLSPAERA